MRALSALMNGGLADAAKANSTPQGGNSGGGMFTGLVAKMGKGLNEMYKKKIVYKSLHERLGLVPADNKNLPPRSKSPAQGKGNKNKRTRTPPGKGPNLAISNMLKKAMEDRVAMQEQLK